MADLLVGTTVQAADVPPTLGDDDASNISGFSESSYVQNDGSAPTVGVAFTAPTSGRVWVLWGARMNGDSAGNRVRVSAHVRTGSTIGSGTTVSTSNNDNLIQSPGKAGGTSSRFNGATHRVVEGLTPGDTYNAVVEYQGTGSIFRRHICTTPLP